MTILERARPAHRATPPRRGRGAVAAGVGAAAALVVGTVLSATGTAVAVRWAQKTGLSVTTLVGALLLALGVVLVAVGLRGAWHVLHRWSRLLLAPLAVVLLMLASSVALAVVYAQAPPTALGPQTPADHDLPYDDVTFPTDDGVRLSGWLVPSRNGTTVVLMHGAGSTRTSTLRHAAVLAANGFGVLAFDARGHGRSAGDGMDLGWYGDADVAAAVRYLHETVGVAPERVALLGLSMGGEQAIGAAAAVPNLPTVVAEGATARTAADKDLWLPGGVTGYVQRRLDTVTYALTDLLTGASPPTPLRDAVRQAERTRFLLITAGDLQDEQRAAAGLRAVAPDRVDVWSVPGAGHTAGLAVDPAGWERRTIAFLTTHVGVAGGPEGRRTP
jgi:uncharacterized protein